MYNLVELMCVGIEFQVLRGYELWEQRTDQDTNRSPGLDSVLYLGIHKPGYR